MRNIQKLLDAHKASSHNKDLVKTKIALAPFAEAFYFDSRLQPMS